MNLGLLNFIEKILNQKGLHTKDDNVAFYCPVCKQEKHKKKLIINLNENSKKFGWWRCWICAYENNMYGRNIVKLLNKLNVEKNKISEFYGLLDKSTILFTKGENIFNDDQLNKPKIKLLNLPQEYIPLYENNADLEYNYAKKYLLGRGITEEEILQYNIGYCKSGIYKNRIIIPSYDHNCNINYFIARSYYDVLKPKYKKPPIEDSNIIFFESFINWKYPIILCEGIFDMIAAKRNAIPINGTYIPHSIGHKIISENVKEIILALDMDIIKTSLSYVQKFISEGINVKIMMLGKKDPAEIGFINFIKLYTEAEPITFEKLIKLKMNI